MTRAEYEAKYGKAPVASSPAPVKMTKEQYLAKYGTPQQKITAKDDTLTKSLINAGEGVGLSIGNTIAGVIGGTAKLGAKAGIPGAQKVADATEEYRQQAFVKPTEKSQQTKSGKAGKIVADVAQYMTPGGFTANVVKDTAIAFGQSQGDLKSAAASGIISAATGGLSKIPLVNKTASSFVGKIAQGGARESQKLAPGYIADVIAGLSGQRGEDRTGSKAFIPGTGTVVGRSIRAIPETVALAQKAKPNPQGIMQRVARVTKGDQVKFKNMTGQDIGEYLVKKGDYGNPEKIIEKNYNRFTESKALADAELAKLPGKYKDKAVKTALDDLFKREKVVSTPGAMSEDFARVNDLRLKHATDGLTMSEINEAKRIYERNIKVEYGRENKRMEVARATNVDNAIRKFQFGQAKKLGLTNLDEINKETQAARFIADKLSKQYAGQAGNNAFTLTDWVAISGGDPTSAIPLYLTKKFFGSKTVQSKIAKAFAPAPEAPISAKYGGVTGLPARVEGVDYSRKPVNNVTIDPKTGKAVGGFNLPQNVSKTDLGIDEVAGANINRQQYPQQRLALPAGGESKYYNASTQKLPTSARESSLGLDAVRNATINRQPSSKVLELPSGEGKNYSNQKTIQLPRSIREDNLGLNEVRNATIRTTPSLPRSPLKVESESVALPNNTPSKLDIANKSGKIPENSKATVNRHVGNAFNILNDPDMHEFIAADPKGFIKSTFDDIVMGLKGEGHIKEAEILSKLDIEDVTSLPTLNAKIEEALNKSTSKARSVPKRAPIDDRLDSLSAMIDDFSTPKIPKKK